MGVGFKARSQVSKARLGVRSGGRAGEGDSSGKGFALLLLDAILY